MTEKPSSLALKKFEDRFTKLFGEGTLTNAAEPNPYEVISTGSLTLDYRLSVGGYVEGRLVEIWGPEGAGKTTLALMAIREAQKKHPEKYAAFIDMEQKLDRAWAVTHGVDLTRLHVVTPDSAEDVADALKEICASGFHSIVVVDSIGAMVPEAEKEKDASESAMGKFAGIVTRMVKIAAPTAQRSGTVVIFINQVRANLGYGADTTTGGGFALKHATTMKLKLKRTGATPYKAKIGKEERIVGHQIAIEVQRNGVAPAYRTAIVNFFHVATSKYGPIGIDRVDEATTLGLDLGIIKQSGAWYNLPGGDRVQGRDGVVDRLRNDLDLLDSIRTAVLASVSSEIQDEVPPEEIVEDEGKLSVADIGSGKPNFKKGKPDDA